MVTVVAVLITLAYVFQRHVIYQPSEGPPPDPDELLPAAEEVTFETGDGLTLGGWFVPAAEPGAVTVLVASGNAGDRSARAPLATALAERGLSTLLFDYRGYGGNPGHPTEGGLALDIRAARAFLLDRRDVRPDRLLYYGESLGAAVVTELATEHPPAGLVLRSPFVDLAAAGRAHFPFLPVRALLKDRFPVRDLIGRITVPTAVVYGSADSVVPPEQSRAVADAAAGPTTVVEVPGADHNDPSLLDGRELITAVARLAAGH